MSSVVLRRDQRRETLAVTNGLGDGYNVPETRVGRVMRKIPCAHSDLVASI